MSAPKSGSRRCFVPVVVHRDRPAGNLRRLLPASLMSVLLHCGLLTLLLVVSTTGTAGPPLESVAEVVVEPEQTTEDKHADPLVVSDIDKAATVPGQEINFDLPRFGPVSVPDLVNPTEAIGVEGGKPDAAPTSLPLPRGFGRLGPGGAIEAPGMFSTDALGPPGGRLDGQPWDYRFPGRSGATRQRLLVNGGGTRESEAAVVAGLEWLVRNQNVDGRWRLDGNFPDRGERNDVAATALGLLPFLGAGHTHKSKDNPFDKPVEKALAFLLRQQDRNGYFGGGLYAHGLAAIAVCEAYGLTQDPRLRRSAQSAVQYIVRAQHAGGGWRYTPGQAGDTSVTGWQVMALKSAQMAGMDVPELAWRKAQRYLDACCATANEGYGYVGIGSTPTMSAVGLLCRQYLQGWGPQNLRLIKGIENHLRSHPPGSMKNMYYHYYATQVLHHFGGMAWKEWNEAMRNLLLKTQDKNGPQRGSWSSAGDPYSGTGGRLLATSLSILTLEVYYRHLPLYYRMSGEKMAGK